MDESVTCVSHDNIIHIIEPSGFTAVFKQAQRSNMLEHMAGSEGTFSLPVSQCGLRLLKEADHSIINGFYWSSRRFSDLGRVAEVWSAALLCALEWLCQQPLSKREPQAHQSLYIRKTVDFRERRPV